MSENKSGCGCCSECTGGPDCTCGCPDCICGDCSCYSDCCVGSNCNCGESKFVLSTVSSILGMFFLGILAILFSINYLDAAWNIASVIVASDYEFLLLCTAAILALIGILSLKAGDVTEGILFFFVGFAVVLPSVCDYFGYGALPYYDWILALILFVVILLLFIGRDLTYGIAVLLYFIGFIFALVFTGDIVPIISGVTFLLAGLILLYVAISDWIFVDTGIDLPIL